AQLPPACDLIFIDTSHTYEQTTAELGIVLEYQPRKVVMHDVNQPQVRQAVDEFLERTGWRMTGYEDGWGLATLEPGETSPSTSCSATACSKTCTPRSQRRCSTSTWVTAVGSTDAIGRNTDEERPA